MMKKIWVFLLLGPSLFAQLEECFTLPETYRSVIVRDLTYLASEDLKGRKPGTQGAILARDYIVKEFKSFGLQGFFKRSFIQEFSVPNRVVRTPEGNTFSYKDDPLKIDEDFYPIYLSGNGSFEGETEYVEFGIESEELDRDDIDDKDLRGNVAVMEISSPDGIHPHSKYKDWHDLKKRVKLLEKKGAKGVILVHNEGNANEPQATFKAMDALSIPVIYLRNERIAKKLRRSRDISLSVALVEIRDEAFNVAAELNNGSPQTIIIGAHYDHLGMGGEGSRAPVQSDEPQVHNGADDNASGTAGLLALARLLSETDNPELRKFNYVFLAFSAEEMGLLGSKFFTEDFEEYDREWLYMLNMDMIGRMEDQSLAINGYGTSPVWVDVVEPIQCGLELKLSESGVGPSDHTSFYYQDLPVLHFFTGTHEDYHKPSDDVEKINFEGMMRTIGFIAAIIRNTPLGEFPFKATKVESTKAPKFSVTLGVMPDYVYNGSGMKIDGVSPDKPASKAGLQAGDIVTQLGEVQVSNMQSYMEALAQFKKGDQTTILYQRDGETKTAQIQF